MGSAWGITKVSADKAWAKQKGSKSIVVAVIDTGVRPHADFSAKLLPGYDFILNTTVAGDGGGRDADREPHERGEP